MTVHEKLFEACVGHLMAAGRASDIGEIERRAKAGMDTRERVEVIRAVAKARVHHFKPKGGKLSMP